MDVLTRLGRLTAGGCVFAALAATPRAEPQTLEPDVKAAYLYHFTKFVEWPPEASASTEPFRLCVAADRAIESAIERVVQGETVSGRPLVVVRPGTPRDAQQCQILYLGRSDGPEAARMLKAVRDQPVLTVGDSSGFAEAGGMIGFLLQDNRVRFDVNLPSAQRSKLRVSSNLLRVARRVLEPPK